jgi:Cation transporting ATPase, C-terminus
VLYYLHTVLIPHAVTIYAVALCAVTTLHTNTHTAMQFFVAYILKATDGHIFTSRAAWRNKVTYAGMVFSLGVAFFVTHTPGVQYVLESDTFPLWALAVPVGMGFVHLVFESLKRRVQRCRRTTTAVAQQQQQSQQQRQQQ